MSAGARYVQKQACGTLGFMRANHLIKRKAACASCGVLQQDLQKCEYEVIRFRVRP